jgi:hypothetical protein
MDRIPERTDKPKGETNRRNQRVKDSTKLCGERFSSSWNA